MVCTNFEKQTVHVLMHSDGTTSTATNPVTVVDDYSIGLREIDSQSSSSRTQQKQEHVVIAEASNLQHQ